MRYPRFLNLIHPLEWFLAAALALGLAACGSGDDGDDATRLSSATTQHKASLSGDQEVPPTITDALGMDSLNLETPSRSVSGSITIDGMTASALNAGGLYFNAHSAANPNGEIRGKIR